MAPGDTTPDSEHNQAHFTFQQYGVRVPAIIVSPRIPKNLIDHRLYDHASIPATLEALFGLSPLTARDAAANRLNALLSLTAARTDAPTKLPNPAASTTTQPVSKAVQPASTAVPTPVARPQAPANDGNLPGILHAALRQDLEVSPAQDRATILARAATIKTREQASHYLDSVRAKVRGLQKGAPGN